MRRRLSLLIVALLCATAGLAGTGPAASAAVDGDTFRGEDVPIKIRWVPCYQEFGSEFECATVRVPLDYDELNGGTTPLALIRLQATGEKKGSVFFNPGGPGGSGVEFILGAGEIFYPEMREHYDFVGFDPRGIALSNPLLCFGAIQGVRRNLAQVGFPVSPAELREWRMSDNYLRTQCRANGGIMQNKMSTANVARDLEVLRAAVGDEQLNFIGLSYGTVIGQVYAGLFPDRVGRIVIDGVVNLRDWVGNPSGRDTTVVDSRLQSSKGAEDSFAEYIRLCEEAGPERCAMAPDADNRIRGLIEKLRTDGPIVVSTPDGDFTITYDAIVGMLLGALYSPGFWNLLATDLAVIEAAVNAGGAAGEVQPATTAPLKLLVERAPKRPKYPNFREGFPGVTCVDTANPSTYAGWVKAVADAKATAPLFAEPWIWSSSACAGWPGRDTDRFTGPFGVKTANPILVMTTRYDPATPYEQAVKANDELANSALVVVNGWGHTTPLASTCGDAIVVDFVVNGVLPADGTVCEADLQDPFGVPPGDDAEQVRTVIAEQSRKAFWRN